MIVYEGQHEILKMNGQLYWRDSHGAIEGINVNVIFGGNEEKSEKDPLNARRLIEISQIISEIFVQMKICCCFFLRKLTSS
jgi:hypothetical protein